MTKYSFLIRVSFVLLFSNSLSYAEVCQTHPQQEDCLHGDTRKRGERLLDTISDLDADFETVPQNAWIDESQTGVRWKIENNNSPWELSNPAPKPSIGRNYMRVDRGVTLSFGVAVLRSQLFQIPSSSNDISISFDFWIRSKWRQLTNLELYFNENGNERLLMSLSNYSDINNRNWVTSPVLPLRSQSVLSNLSLVFYAYCGRDVEDAVVIDNIRVIGLPRSTETVLTSTKESVTTTSSQSQCSTRSYNQRVATAKDERNVKNGRIVGGEETTPNEFPWMAHLNVSFWSGEFTYCSGTLINNRWVLTAAHCLYGSIAVTITLGAHDFSSTNHDQHKLFHNLNYSYHNYHSDWYFGSVENDIALIRLPEEITFSQYIQSIRLPYPDDPDQVGDSVVMTGWGNYSNIPDSGNSPVLRKVDTTVISNNICQQDAGVGSFSNDKIICGDGSQGKRYCSGDDGGPMLHYRENEQQWFVIGVAGTGDYTTNCQASGKPNIYVRIRHYFDWIYNVTGIQPVTTTTSTTFPHTTTTKTTPRDPVRTTYPANEFTCPGNGFHPVPDLQCTPNYYCCFLGIAYLQSCQETQIFNYQSLKCIEPENDPSCG